MRNLAVGGAHRYSSRKHRALARGTLHGTCGKAGALCFQSGMAIRRNAQDAEDIVQETFLKLYRSNISDSLHRAGGAEWEKWNTNIKRRYLECRTKMEHGLVIIALPVA